MSISNCQVQNSNIITPLGFGTLAGAAVILFAELTGIVPLQPPYVVAQVAILITIYFGALMLAAWPIRRIRRVISASLGAAIGDFAVGLSILGFRREGLDVRDLVSPLGLFHGAVYLLIIWLVPAFVLSPLVVFVNRKWPLWPRGHCTKCGYDLRALPEPRCPECGRPFNPKDSLSSDPL